MSDRHSISPYPIRMPHDLRERLEASAKSGNRSLHAEIIARLAASYADEDRRQLTHDEVAAAARLEAMVVASFEELNAKMQERLQAHIDLLKQEALELEHLKPKDKSGSS